MPRRLVQTSILFGLCAIFAGCGEAKPEFGLVTGVVKVKGKPQKGLIVRFLPDPDKGNVQPYNASGTTDAEGKYELRYAHKGEEGTGASVGWNRVVVEDTRYSAIPQGAPVPPRLFSSAYGSISGTPLAFEVKPGPQTIDIDLTN